FMTPPLKVNLSGSAGLSSDKPRRRLRPAAASRCTPYASPTLSRLGHGASVIALIHITGSWQSKDQTRRADSSRLPDRGGGSCASDPPSSNPERACHRLCLTLAGRVLEVPVHVARHVERRMPEMLGEPEDRPVVPDREPRDAACP